MKRIAAFITAMLILCFIIIPSNSVQAMGIGEIIRNVEQTNIQINEQIEKAVYVSQIATDNYNDDLRGLQKNKESISKKDYEKLQRLEKEYNAKIDIIIKDLLNVTNEMAAKTINPAARQGVTVYCQWVKVTIAGRTVMVDPLRIANF